MNPETSIDKTVGGFNFVPLSEYPKHIRTVVEPRDILVLYRSEITWAVNYVVQSKGFGITLPQIGAPINIVVARLSRSAHPFVICNLSYTADLSLRHMKHSIEGDYTVDAALIAAGQKPTMFAVNRFRKIYATWEEVGGTEKEPKLVKKTRTFLMTDVADVSSACLIQNLCDHTRNDYVELLERKLAKVQNKYNTYVLNALFPKGDADDNN